MLPPIDKCYSITTTLPLLLTARNRFNEITEARKRALCYAVLLARPSCRTSAWPIYRRANIYMWFRLHVDPQYAYRSGRDGKNKRFRETKMQMPSSSFVARYVCTRIKLQRVLSLSIFFFSPFYLDRRASSA